MKICLIAEGSYPYVTGGVSSWIQMLVSNMPEHEFIIFAINANENEHNSYKYEIPDNVLEIKDIYLEVAKDKQKKSNVKVSFNDKEKDIILKFITGEYFDWQDFFDYIKRIKHVNTIDIVMSEDFFDIVSEVAKKYYPYIVFNHFFWTVRSMIITVFEVLKSDIPEADIYHSVSTGYAGLVGALGKYYHKNSKFILTEHGIYTREREEEIIKADWVKGYFKDSWIKYFYNLSRAAYTYTDKVFTLFQKNKDLQIELGCKENKIQIIPNGVKLERFSHISRKTNDDSIINIGAIVRVVPIKDLKTIIQAFILANETIKDMKLYIMGPMDEDKDYTKECIDFAESSDNKNIVFTDRVNVLDYIGKMDILILGSISEGQPLSVLEGMAAKKPYITTNVGSCKELLYGNNDGLGHCGIVVPVMGYYQMAQSIIKLSRDEDLRKEMGEIGFKRASLFYTQEQFIENYRKIYRELV
ncbi:GT4 family glycosyltransferase PelF [Clostridium perfringens]|uniref:GT4 family glycosyltransferase PelF n=1 Tax=Clostridium perfringens TaxID=1502 RepID=UPI00224675B2|nr:GT4 family glycosyltransferase PelF [Clostridium perfringens]MCX0371703.1 GT4 family glycosyltransferase PelF [Clostridium perfringens]